ncbi:S9 family peptidase [Brevibacterium gallinarum]|uniref:S9 family peptidase n=1 Tax=Brevibacterium gallinarum TaxID=2762220 RepID=A0ABR8WRL4_9MICO|nr:prolyl oligopeptidase family serine peptidase [Brevibacterium gallinarum]MBD8019727.1 S9 family peptidase [Brevibacterium gallinarum]
MTITDTPTSPGISIDALLDAHRLNGLAANPTGGAVALVQTVQQAPAAEVAEPGETADRDDAAGDPRAGDYLTALYTVDEAPVRLTSPLASVGAASVDDAGNVWFIAKRANTADDAAEDASLWKLPARGEAIQMATRPGGFSSVTVRGTTVLATGPIADGAEDEKTHAELYGTRTAHKVTGILHDSFPLRSWDSDLGPDRDGLLIADCSDTGRSDSRDAGTLSFRHGPVPAGRVTGVELSADGTVALLDVRRLEEKTTEVTDIWRVDIASGDAGILLHAAHPIDYTTQALSPSGRFAAVSEETAWTAQSNLQQRSVLVDLATGAAQPLWPAGDQWYSITWLDDDTLLATSDYRGRGAVWIGGPDDAQPRLLAGGADQPYHYSSLVSAPEGVLAIRSSVAEAPHLVAIDTARGDVAIRTNPADDLAPAGRLEEVVTTAADGTEIRAWLALPATASAAETAAPHPLAVFVHGGPWGSWNAWTYRWNPWPFVAAGYAVLMPDPAISTGYGQAFIDRGQQELGGAPFDDVVALADAAIARADIDETRQALAGGSYGGYMANWVAGHTGDRFRCIVTHASLWDVTTMGATTDNGSWALAMAEQAQTYSPHLYVRDIEVPVLVIHGDKDYRVPIGQGQQLWFDLLTFSKTPLDAHGKTQHRFLYYPNENHWILSRGNARQWYQEFIAFLDQHVTGA